MANGTTRMAATNISKAVLTPMSISPRSTLMKNQARSHTRPITAAEMMSTRLKSVMDDCLRTCSLLPIDRTASYDCAVHRSLSLANMLPQPPCIASRHPKRDC